MSDPRPYAILVRKDDDGRLYAEPATLKGIRSGPPADRYVLAQTAEAWRDALAELVALKRERDTNGKTGEYEARQPAAWRKAREVLGIDEDDSQGALW